MHKLLPGSLNYVLLLIINFTLFFSSCTTPEAALADKKAYTEDNPAYRNKFEYTLDENEKPLRYGYYYVVSQVPEGYKVRVFHPDKKTLTEEKIYSTPSLTLLHGFYKSYWDDGSIREQGTYQYGRKHGLWVEAEPGKGKSASGEYDNHRKEGLWTQLDSNGMVESVYNFHDDRRHGKFFLYNAAGDKTNEGLYRNDTLIAELFKQPLFTKPYIQNCKVELVPDVYQCSDNVVIQYVYSELKYPSSAKEHRIEGKAVAQWDVNADGSISNIRVPKAISDDIEKEILRVLAKLPSWKPGTKDGVPVRQTVSLPVNFKL